MPNGDWPSMAEQGAFYQWFRDTYGFWKPFTEFHTPWFKNNPYYDEWVSLGKPGYAPPEGVEGLAPTEGISLTDFYALTPEEQQEILLDESSERLPDLTGWDYEWEWTFTGDAPPHWELIPTEEGRTPGIDYTIEQDPSGYDVRIGRDAEGNILEYDIIGRAPTGEALSPHEQAQLGLSERELALQERIAGAEEFGEARDWIKRWQMMRMPTEALQPSYPMFDGQTLNREGIEAAIQMETGFDPRELYNIQLTTGTLPVSALQGYRQAWEPYVTQPRPEGWQPLSMTPGMTGEPWTREGEPITRRWGDSPQFELDVTGRIGAPEEPVYIPCNSYEDFISKFFAGYIYPNLSANYPQQVRRHVGGQDLGQAMGQYNVPLIQSLLAGEELTPTAIQMPQQAAAQPTTPPAPGWLPAFVPQLSEGQPIEKYPITTPSGQLWGQTPWSVQQGLAGYADWSGHRPIEDIMGHMEMMKPRTPYTGGRWTPAYARA